MSGSNHDERRHFHRVSFEDEATLILGENRYTGRISDVSLKGALLALDGSNTSVTVGASGTLSFPLNPEIVIAMNVTVAHVEDDHIGLHCDTIDLESMQHLRRLVEHNLGDEELLHRDLAAMYERL